MAASFSLLCSVLSSMLVAAQKRVYTNTLVSQVNKKTMTYIFWALFDGLSSWAKENKPNTVVVHYPSIVNLAIQPYFHEAFKVGCRFRFP